MFLEGWDSGEGSRDKNGTCSGNNRGTDVSLPEKRAFGGSDRELWATSFHRRPCPVTIWMMIRALTSYTKHSTLSILLEQAGRQIISKNLMKSKKGAWTYVRDENRRQKLGNGTAPSLVFGEKTQTLADGLWD